MDKLLIITACPSGGVDSYCNGTINWCKIYSNNVIVAEYDFTRDSKAVRVDGKTVRVE